jgi:prevent-host-death family protein
VTAYSVAEAKNTLPKLIDRALQGEEVVITRHGKPVAELKPARGQPAAPAATYSWLQSRRRARPGVGLTSVEILDRLYEPDER